MTAEKLFENVRKFVKKTCPQLDDHDVSYVTEKIYYNMRFILDDERRKTSTQS